MFKLSHPLVYSLNVVFFSIDFTRFPVKTQNGTKRKRFPSCALCFCLLWLTVRLFISCSGIFSQVFVPSMYHREAAQLSARGGDMHVSCSPPSLNVHTSQPWQKHKKKKKQTTNVMQFLCHAAAAGLWDFVQTLTCACLHVLDMSLRRFQSACSTLRTQSTLPPSPVQHADRIFHIMRQWFYSTVTFSFVFLSCFKLKRQTRAKHRLRCHAASKKSAYWKVPASTK